MYRFKATNINPYWRYTCLALLALTLSACATVRFGQDFDLTDFQQWIKRGETTQAAVVNRYGEPTTRGVIIEKDDTHYTRWVYYYANGKLHKLKNIKLKILEIHFDQDNKVASYNWSE